MENILHGIAAFITDEKESVTEILLQQAAEQLELSLSEEQLAQHYELLELLLDKVSKGLLLTRQETQELDLDYDVEQFFYNDGTLLQNTVEIISTFRLLLHRELLENVIEQ